MDYGNNISNIMTMEMLCDTYKINEHPPLVYNNIVMTFIKKINTTMIRWSHLRAEVGTLLCFTVVTSKINPSLTLYL